MDDLLINNPFPDYVFPVEPELLDPLWTITPAHAKQKVDHQVFMNISFHHTLVYVSDKKLSRYNNRYIIAREMGFTRHAWNEWIKDGTTQDISVCLSWCLNKDCTDLDNHKLRRLFEKYCDQYYYETCESRDPCYKFQLKRDMEIP